MNHGWQSKSTDGPKGGWSCAFCSGCSGHLTYNCWMYLSLSLSLSIYYYSSSIYHLSSTKLSQYLTVIYIIYLLVYYYLSVICLSVCLSMLSICLSASLKTKLFCLRDCLSYKALMFCSLLTGCTAQSLATRN